MKKFTLFLIFALVFCIVSANIYAQKTKTYKPITLENSAELQLLVNRAADDTVIKFASKGFKAENLAITLIDMRNPDQLKMAAFRGNEKIYPASVVKMFYLVALHQLLENRKVKLTPEITRATRDMIVDSSNEATQFIVDVVTDTSSGAELLPKELEKWGFKRNSVNRYFTSLGYSNINVCQKTFCEDAYGREQQFRGKDGVNRNKLNTNATARLLAEIALGKVVTAVRSTQMMELMKRNWEGTSTDNDDQGHGFTGITLKKLNLTGAKLWSKAGWTSTTRHDAAYIELPNGAKFVLVTFTTNFANEREIIPNVARVVLENFGEKN